MKSCPIGFLSFFFILLFTYWFISICVDLFNYNQITSTSQNTLSSKSTEPNGTFETFGVSLDYLDFSDFEDMFMFQTTILTNTTTRNIPMKPCRADQWKLLGDNYKQIFNQLSIWSMYCPDTTQKFTIQGIPYASNEISIMVSLRFCDQATNIYCDVQGGLQWIKNQTQTKITSSQLQIVVLDKTLYPSRKNVVGYLPNFDAAIQITSQISAFAKIQFSYFNIQTDYSFLPTVDKQNQNGIHADNVRTGVMAMQNVSTGLIACAFFSMNSKVEKLTRNVGKLDNVLSYTGGLLSILMGFLGFFLMSFNEYRYELKIAEGRFHSTNPSSKVNIRQNNMNFWVYIKYTVYDWINLLCCCQLKWKQCEEIDEVLDQIKSQMELQRIFKRLQNIDRGLDRLIGEDTRTCMSLMKLPTREQLKVKRLINDYYDEIIKKSDQIKQQRSKKKNNKSLKPQLIYKQNSMASINNQGISINLQQIMNQSQKSKSVNRIHFSESQQFSPEQIKKISNISLSQDLQQVENKILETFGKLDTEEIQYFESLIPAGIYYRIQKKLENQFQLIINLFKYSEFLVERKIKF